MMEMKYVEGYYVGKIQKPGIRFSFRLAIPCVETKRLALLVDHDGLNEANVQSMLRLAKEGKAPYCVSIGVSPGELVLPDGSSRYMRMNNYDLFDREYGDFLVYELIPYIQQKYGLLLDPSPDMHMVSGGSSGGLSAFVIAWFHPEYFHRVYMSSPSFLAMGRGNELPYLIRKYETKPLRIYEEYSENEPNDYFGWSRGIDEEAREALRFANYDFQCTYFEKEGHCSRELDESEAYRRNEWIWKNWECSPVIAKRNSVRVEQVIPVGSVWERCAAFPDKKAATQNLSDQQSRLHEKYSHVVLANDRQVWYLANKDEEQVYLVVNRDDHSADQRIIHTVLHTIPGQAVKGVQDMAVDKTDRLYLLTEMGIQCVRSFGLIDVILELPDSAKPLAIAVTDALYVRTENGVYRRKLCDECITESEKTRKHTGYYD